MTDTPLARDAAALARLVLDAGPAGTVVFSGAGISTESGIPDFRGPSGLWTQNAPIDFRDFIADAEMRRESWRRGLNTYAAIAAAAPNAAHQAIGEWWQSGLLLGVITQNIDGLHQRGGVSEEGVAEIHGNAHRVRCLTCAALLDRPSVHERILAGEAEPRCHDCGGILKSTTVSFGQAMPPEPFRRAERWVEQARLCLVIGSSLVVYPAAALPELALSAGAALAVVNATQTPLDDAARLVSRLPAAVLLGATATLIRAVSQ